MFFIILGIAVSILASAFIFAATGTLRAAQQGVFQITPEYSTETSDSGFSDTSAINKKVKAVVTAEFTLNN